MWSAVRGWARVGGVKQGLGRGMSGVPRYAPATPMQLAMHRLVQLAYGRHGRVAMLYVKWMLGAFGAYVLYCVGQVSPRYFDEPQRDGGKRRLMRYVSPRWAHAYYGRVFERCMVGYVVPKSEAKSETNLIELDSSSYPVLPADDGRSIRVTEVGNELLATLGAPPATWHVVSDVGSRNSARVLYSPIHNVGLVWEGCFEAPLRPRWASWLIPATFVRGSPEVIDTLIALEVAHALRTSHFLLDIPWWVMLGLECFGSPSSERSMRFFDYYCVVQPYTHTQRHLLLSSTAEALGGRYKSGELARSVLDNVMAEIANLPLSELHFLSLRAQLFVGEREGSSPLD